MTVKDRWHRRPSREQLAALCVVGLLVSAAIPGLAADLDLSGRWAVVLTMVGSGELPLVGPATVSTVIGLLTTVEQEGNLLTMQDTYCVTTICMDPPMAETTVPDRFMDSLTPSVRLGTLSNGEDGKVLFTQDWHTEVRGAVLVDEVSDPLPLDVYDPRVIDQDGDGFPGLTIPVTIPDVVSGDTYVVHRLRYRLDGRVVDRNRIVGSIEWTSEQNVILATDLVLMVSVSLPAADDLALQRFVMVRVDDSWTPETVRERLDTLLAQL
jgi:hypothetical protein